MRGDIVAAARGWLGTPYRHRASLKGVGCDCLGLVRGVWREAVGPEPEDIPAYAADWAEADGGEPLLAALGRWFEPVGVEAAEPGDVLAFRMAEGAAVKHLAILTGPAPSTALRAVPLPRQAGEDQTIVHAYWGRAVVESWLQPWWRRRLAGAWRFPGGGT